MAVKIKLKRLGKIRNPQYRIVVADARTKRDGRAIEEIGKYHPKEDPSLIEIDSERALYWLGVGAQPTDPVLNLLKITGDWQKHKGLPGTEGTLRKAEEKADKQAVYDVAVKEGMKEGEGAATTPKSKKKAEPKKAEAKKTDKAEKADKADKGEKAEKPAKADKAEEPAEAKADEKPAEAPAEAQSEA